MNTKTVQNTAVRSLPVFPELTGDKRTRVITKHFTNLALWLPAEELSLITWLIYDSKVDNSVEYSTHLLTRYGKAIIEANKYYGTTPTLNTSLKANRSLFKTLIEKGLLLPSFKEKLFIINPMLYYRPEYMRPKDYAKITGAYQVVSSGIFSTIYTFDDYIKGFSEEYIKTVQKYLVKKRA